MTNQPHTQLESKCFDLNTDLIDDHNSDWFDTDERACLLPNSERSINRGVRVKLRQLTSQLFKGNDLQQSTRGTSRYTTSYQKLSQEVQNKTYNNNNSNFNKYTEKQAKIMSAPSTSSNVGDAAAAAITGNLHLPPLRSLDDFVFGSARFQLPNLKDLEKWGNRVVKNLLYYQTNYFLLWLAIYALMIVVNPTKIISGLLVQAFLIAVIWQFFGKKPKSTFIATRLTTNAAAVQQNAQQKWYVLAGALLSGYLLLHMLSAVLLTTFTLLLPISVIFVHASLRLRNIKNKLSNTIDSFGPSTPMGSLLDAVNVRAEGMLN